MKENIADQYFQNELTLKEKEELFDQLEAAPSTKELFVQCHNTWALSELLTTSQDVKEAEKGYHQFQRRIRADRVRKQLFAFSKYAALFIFTICTMWFLFNRPVKEQQFTEIKSPIGQRTHLILSDGSEVWLSSNTKMILPQQFDKKERCVEIDGEAFFSVAKDQKKPFIVKTKKYNVKVLGTKFNLFAYSNSPKFEADLISGSIDVFNQREEIRLLPQEKVILKDNALIKKTSTYINEDNLSSGIFSFEAMSFGEILEYLSAWYDVQFTTSPSTSFRTLVSGKFRQSDSVEEILMTLQTILSFEYTLLDQNQIKIVS